MIRELAVELGKYLKTQGCPIPVIDGPELHATTTWGRERVVVEHDLDGTDSFGPVRSQHSNPKAVAVRNQAVKATIYVQSAGAAARVFEHRRRANNVLDQVLGGLRTISAERKNQIQLSSGRFFVPEDLEGAAVHAGAAYELKFTFERTVPFETFQGEIQPEAAPGTWGMKSTTKVSRAGGADDDGNDNTVPANAEAACGA